MHWRLKALTQKAIALLPRDAGDAVYGRLQRRLGGLRSLSVMKWMKAAAAMAAAAESAGTGVAGRSVLDVGTGRVPLLPVGLWLLGARRIVTVDPNRYLADDLLDPTLRSLLAHRERLAELFGEDALVRLAELARRLERPADAVDRLAELGIEYRAPADATALADADDSFDLQVSRSVFEHVPPTTLVAILREGSRVVAAHGALIHAIDYSDHLAHGDGNRSPIEFLSYPDRRWAFWADNRFMYMNRLRHDDMLDLFASAGLIVAATEPTVDDRLLASMEKRRPRLAARFADKSDRTLATLSSLVVAHPAREARPSRSLAPGASGG